ncbi:MAG: metallophosphoesterase family protein, partial [bacterium]
MPDAVFCVGDLVQGYSRSHEHVLGERRDFLDTVGALRMPFYPTPGNHDLVSGLRDGKDRSFADSYRRLFGPLYYAVELELASFVILNTEDGGGNIEPGFSDAQLAWLDTTLVALQARGRPIILLFHRPLWD